MFLVDILKSDCILDKWFDVQIKKLEIDDSIIVKGDFEISSCVFGEAAWYLEYAIFLFDELEHDWFTKLSISDHIFFKLLCCLEVALFCPFHNNLETYMILYYICTYLANNLTAPFDCRWMLITQIYNCFCIETTSIDPYSVWKFSDKTYLFRFQIWCDSIRLPQWLWDWLRRRVLLNKA